MKQILALLVILFIYGCFSAPVANVKFTPTLGIRPDVRSAPQLIRADDKAILLFGFLECFFIGAPFCENYFYNQTQTYILDLSYDPFTWEIVNTTGNPPVRTFFGADYYANANKIVFYGGVFYTADLSTLIVYSDVWLFDIATNQFTQVIYPNNTGPGPRIGITLKVVGDAFYFFGGFDPTFTGHNDMWKFDLIANTWTLLIPNSNSTSAPIGRYLYNAVLDDTRLRYYFFSGSQIDNGVSFETVNDTWYYNFATNSYVVVLPLSNATNDGRIHSASTFYKKRYFVVVQGSENDNENECPTVSFAGPQGPTDTIIFLDTNNVSLGWIYADIDTNNIGLKRISGFLVDGDFYWTAGFGFSCPSNTTSTPDWNSYLWSVKLNSIVNQ